MADSLTIEGIQVLIFRVLAALREDLSLPPLEKMEASTPLLGAGSDLDSMSVVHLIADLESELELTYGRIWVLADERALSRSRSPFRTIGTLAQYILESADE